MEDENQPLQIFNTTNSPLPISESSFLKLLQKIEKEESVNFDLIELVYVDEKEIVRVNQEYLNRDYITDIISFRYDVEDDVVDNDHIEGTLYCCAERISEQAIELDEDTKTEFARIFIHGLLHLAGYNDQDTRSKKEMTTKENHYLSYL